jgi:hypothetical protein
VVEGETIRDSIDRKPPGFRRIVAGLWQRWGIQDGKEGDGYRPPARIAIRVAESADLAQARHDYARLFRKLSSSGVFEILVGIHKTTGQSPRSGEWVVTAPDQQDGSSPVGGPGDGDCVYGYEVTIGRRHRARFLRGAAFARVPAKGGLIVGRL